MAVLNQGSARPQNPDIAASVLQRNRVENANFNQIVVSANFSEDMDEGIFCHQNMNSSDEVPNIKIVNSRHEAIKKHLQPL